MYNFEFIYMLKILSTIKEFLVKDRQKEAEHPLLYLTLVLHIIGWTLTCYTCV